MDVLIIKVTANAMIAYNSGNTANIIVFPNTSYPDSIPAIPFAVTEPCFSAENSETIPRDNPAAR